MNGNLAAHYIEIIPPAECLEHLNNLTSLLLAYNKYGLHGFGASVKINFKISAHIPIDWLWLKCQNCSCEIAWPVDLANWWLTDCQTNQMPTIENLNSTVVWILTFLTGWLFTYWLTDWLTDWQIDWLIDSDWLDLWTDSDWLDLWTDSDWLADWLAVLWTDWHASLTEDCWLIAWYRSC